MASKKTDYRQHTCGECRLYVPNNTKHIPEWLIGQHNTGSCKPWVNGATVAKVQREMMACSNFRKRRKPPKSKKVCVCRECQYNNPTPDGHWCALLQDYKAAKECISFKKKDYSHDEAMPARFVDKWNELNSL